MEKRFEIPAAFMIVVDDVGWWCGNDHRYKNGPSRSGIERRHCIEDYEAIIEIGKEMGMRIKCGFVIGEWDRTNLLASVKNSNKYGSLWDNARYFNREEAERVVDLINSNGEYIELALHGVMHMFWDDSGKLKYAEFFQRDEAGTKVEMAGSDIIRSHLDAFYEIYNQNGFNAKINSFIPPCFIYKYDPGEGGLSRILSQYGIKYISTIFKSMGMDDFVLVENKIITVDRTSDLTPWYEVDAQVPEVIKQSYYGMHWPNFLSCDPADNPLSVKRWIEYFKQYKGRFDILPAKNNEEASIQALYKKYLSVEEKEDYLIFNFDMVDMQNAGEPNNYFFINALKEFSLSSDMSLDINQKEVFDSYRTYMITRKKPYKSYGEIKFERKVL